jgi:hypothetical protein
MLNAPGNRLVEALALTDLSFRSEKGQDAGRTRSSRPRRLAAISVTRSMKVGGSLHPFCRMKRYSGLQSMRRRPSVCLSAHQKTSAELRVGVNAIDQVMQLGRTKNLLESDAVFASATLDVKLCCVSNSRSGVPYRIAVAAGKFP